MKLLMTGANGFVGKRLLTFLKLQENIDITLLTSSEIVGYNCIIHKDYNMPATSITNSYDCLLLLGGVAPKGNGKDKESNYIDNITSTVKIIETLENFPSKVIYISSVSVYDDSNGTEISEESPLTTNSLYGLSKIVCEKYLMNKCHENNAELSILRLGPVYGPGEEKYNKIAGFFIKQAAKNECINIKSDGSEKRNMIYVDDVARIITSVICNRITIDIVNVVSPETISVIELAKKIVSISNSNSDINVLNLGRGRNDSYSSAKILSLFEELGLPFTSYEVGLRQTFNHFKEQNVE